MKIDQSKLRRQKEIVGKWADNNYRGTLEAVTGFGKTFASLIGAKDFFTTLKEAGRLSYYRENYDYMLVVVVPTDYLREKWRADLKRHNLVSWGDVRVDTVHNLIKEDISTAMLIPDELHMYVGEDAEYFPTVFERVTSKAIFGLTATLGNEGIMRDLVDSFCPVVDTVNTQEALDNGWVSDHVIYNLGIQMPERDKQEYEKLNKKFHRFFSTFGHDFDKARKCASDEEYARRYALSKNYDTEYVQIRAWNFMRVMRERKNYLYNAPVKLDVCEQIVSRFPNRKTITFSQSTDFADKLSDRLGDIAVAYHSSLSTEIRDENDKVIARAKKIKENGSTKTVYEDRDENRYSWSQIKVAYPNKKLTRMGKTRLRKEALRKFGDNRYKIQVMCSAKALDVGLDIPDIDMGIVASGTSTTRQNIQRNGRVIRYVEGKQAIIVQLYILDSQDETWLERRQGDNPNVKWIYDIDQIAA